jgi:MHS family citrate/tricarballylate:H+ symporter-like MFS transporter
VVMIAPTIVLLLIAVPVFTWVVSARNGVALIGGAIALQTMQGLAAPSALTAITEGLSRRIRAGTLGLTYAVAISVFGGSTQYNVAWLTRATGSPMTPAWYLTAGVAVALVAMLFMPETAPRRGQALP